ncbi:MAG TPA: MMPL family transporter, partial [Gaiellaceae bacterium]
MSTPEKAPLLARFAHQIVRHRRAVIAVWIVLTIFGMFSASQVSKRWFESFSIPGYSAYEANQRTLHTFGTGEQAPLVAVFHSNGDITKATGVTQAIDAAAKVNPGSRVSSFWSTGSRAYVSKDGHTAFAEIYPPGTPKFSSSVHIDQVRAKLKASTPAGVQSSLTGRDALYAASSGGSSGPSVLTEALIGGLGSLVILFFVFGTLPAVLMPIAIAIASILNTFTLVWVLTYITNVSIIVQFLIALVGLG